MKKKLISILLTLCIAACLLPVTSAAASNWYDTYQDFVLNQRYLQFNGISYGTSEYDKEPYFDYLEDKDYSHFLWDLNKDGIPELFVDTGGMTIGAANTNVFSYTSQGVVYLGMAPGYCIGYDKNGKYPGLFFEAGGIMYGGMYYLFLQNGRIATEDMEEKDDWPPTKVTTNEDLYRVYQRVYQEMANSDDENLPVLNAYSVKEIKSMGWDVFVAKYGFSKPVSFAGFYDVQEGDWFAAPVLWAVENKITNGTGNNQFSPNQTCTTAQILTFLWRAAGSPEPSTQNPFSDVKSSDYFYKAAVWAAEKGLVSGEKFNGATPCTRSATVTYLWKLSGSPGAGSSAFTDVSSSAPYSQAVAWAVSKGVTSGIGNNKFSPNDTCTRGQIVTFLYRWTHM